jgi:hypothetical protein
MVNSNDAVELKLKFFGVFASTLKTHTNTTLRKKKMNLSVSLECLEEEEEAAFEEGQNKNGRQPILEEEDAILLVHGWRDTQTVKGKHWHFQTFWYSFEKMLPNCTRVGGSGWFTSGNKMEH